GCLKRMEPRMERELTESRTTRETSPSGPPGAVPARRAREVGNVELRRLSAYYGANQAVREVRLGFDAGSVTAIIGPSACGKWTMVRCVNRMHEEISGARTEGEVLLDGLDL